MLRVENAVKGLWLHPIRSPGSQEAASDECWDSVGFFPDAQSENGAPHIQGGSSHQSSATVEVFTATPRDNSKTGQADNGLTLTAAVC